ncbi:MAG: sigma-70 family RNA polymerase sigma factor [Lachnospiraceae bacterium]|nr:sigma-70 family RNA polymerase sigma factor [Lachnospiraceae bacterium]
MKRTTPLTNEQQEMVAANLSVVHWTIRESFHVNETIYGFGYDDLYQEGCIWLCHAAVSYNPALSKFPTYAKKVVQNGLTSYCREQCSRERHFTRLGVGEHGELTAEGSILQQADDFESRISMLEVMQLLESRARDYNGVTRLGIKALELKIRGMSITEIAKLYDVPPSHVGAWITRSKQKLRKDPLFLSGIT